jgi:hypothetical protein
MNERIKELLEEAGVKYIVMPSPATAYEKFAELIVKECMDVAYDHTPNSEECEYKRLIHNKIRDHFGVEE